MKLQNVCWWCWSILLIGFFLVPESVQAIPAFARRYKISCSTCHAPIPKLKAYGDEFAGNGFIIPEEEKKRDYVSAGDDLLWLNRDFPVAVRFDAYTLFDDRGPIKDDLQIPWGLKLMSGGTLYKSIGYYFYFYLSERGEVAGIEDAYVHFNNIFDTELDVMVGQFQTSDPLMKRELRLTFEDYEIYKARIGESGTNLAYDRGVMLTYAIPQTGTDLVGLVVNGNGKKEAGEDRTFDDDKYKNFGFRLSQALGEKISIGGYFYYGEEDRPDSTHNNELIYWGPDVNVNLGILEFTGQYLLRKDSRPYFNRKLQDIKTGGVIAELVFAPQKDRSRYYLTALYNRIDSDLDEFDYETATVSATYLVARNLRLSAEYTRDLLSDGNRFAIGLVSAF
ncbi:MAG: hypothetical protein Kow0042_27600 [Calditrichia bacterium]